jgi:hypothetical protein
MNLSDQESEKINLVKLKKVGEMYGFEYASIYQMVKLNFKNICDCIYKIGGRYYADKNGFENWLRAQKTQR